MEHSLLFGDHTRALLRAIDAENNPERKALIENLPILSEDDLVKLNQRDSCCPICFTPFLALLAAEEMALAMDSSATATQDLGVTRLADTCGHLYCRKDISMWIRDAHDSCPTCRRPFITASTESQEGGAIPETLTPTEFAALTREYERRLNELVADDTAEYMPRLSPMDHRDARSPQGDDSSGTSPRHDEGNTDRHELFGMYS